MSIVAAVLLATAQGLADAEPAWVPFTLTPADQIRFAAQIDGRTVVAVLDTGVTTSTLSRAFADAARLAVTSGGRALTIGDPIATGWTPARTIGFGAATYRPARLAVATWPRAATGGEPVDLLIGTDVTASFALDIDYDGRRFRLLPSGRMPFRGTIAPLRADGAWPFYRTSVAIAGVRIDRLAVDTGDGTDLALSRAAAKAIPLPGPITTTLDYAAGGATVTTLMTLPTVRIGAMTVPDVALRIQAARGLAEATGTAGRIGSGLLRRYRVLLDPRAGRMVLAPGHGTDRPRARSTSGFLLTVRSDRLVILHVMRGSPAERAGWTAGDAICAVDDAPVTPAYAGSTAATWPIGAAGRTVRLRDCTGAVRPVTLAAFY